MVQRKTKQSDNKRAKKSLMKEKDLNIHITEVIILMGIKGFLKYIGLGLKHLKETNST